MLRRDLSKVSRIWRKTLKRVNPPARGVDERYYGLYENFKKKYNSIRSSSVQKSFTSEPCFRLEAQSSRKSNGEASADINQGLSGVQTYQDRKSYLSSFRWRYQPLLIIANSDTNWFKVIILFTSSLEDNKNFNRITKTSKTTFRKVLKKPWPSCRSPRVAAILLLWCKRSVFLIKGNLELHTYTLTKYVIWINWPFYLQTIDNYRMQ